MGDLAHQPRKRFGQHFLNCEQTLEAMVDAIAPAHNERMIEIGPGPGVLTERLIPVVTDFSVIEIDRDLVAHLKKRFADYSICVHEGDVLSFDFASVLSTKKPTRIVGNLPYNISTPLLFRLFPWMSAISSCYFLLQKEVVDRLCALPGSKTYGRLSVMTQYFCQAESLFDVPPAAFSPPPKVDSSFVCLRSHDTMPAVARDFQVFEDVVRHAFCYRRKMLKKIFKNTVTEDQWRELSLDSTQRPEQLGVSSYVALSNLIVTQRDEGV